MKRLRLCLLVMLVLFNISACGKKAVDPVAQKVIDDINALGEITLDDKSSIEKITETYATLTDEQKNQVTNYIDLINAKDRIEELEMTEKNSLDAKASEIPECFLIEACNELKSSCSNSESFEINSIEYTDLVTWGTYDKSSGLRDMYKDEEVYFIRIEFSGENGFGGTASETAYGEYWVKDGKVSIVPDVGGDLGRVYSVYQSISTNILIANGYITYDDIGFIASRLD